MPASSWAAQQLVEFLARVGSCETEEAAMQAAVEHSMAAVEADVGAVVVGDRVRASLGFPEGAVPEDDLAAAARRERDEIDVPGLGTCAVLSVPLEEHGADEDEPQGWLLVARAREMSLDLAETNLTRGLARVLAMTLRLQGGIAQERELRKRTEHQSEENARLLRSLAERQKLLEKLSRIQSSIVRRAALHETLEAVVAGARELIGDSIAAVRLVDENDAGATVIVSSAGVDPDQLDRERRGRVGEGVGGRAIAENRLVVIEDYDRSHDGLSTFTEAHLQAAMAAPVHERGEVMGSLTVATYEPGRTYSTAERDALMAFAEHASLALTDAKTVGDALHQAFHDSLTGLPNRSLFLDRLGHALARADRSGDQVAVLFLDLDSFKRVNDSLGHGAGDELLALVADRLANCVRPGDTAARFGGDEFALLLEAIPSVEEAERVAVRVLDALQKRFELGRRGFSIGASIGIASGGGEAEDLLRDADLAMYRAKASGKNRYVVFEPDMHAAVVEQVELEVGLDRAVENGELFLEYQPIVRLETGEMAGAEALVRWNHPERGMLAPADFIPLAEETRAILGVGSWVLGEACRAGANWRRMPGRERLAVCVNLSAIQIQQPELPAEVSAALAAAHLEPDNLILEITETVLMHDMESNVRRLGQLKELGVRLAVDDFGTGYSSLQYLRGFPIDILKIAKSFVDGVGGAWEESALARAIIDLGGSFQLQVVAEGIETPHQAMRLQHLGCQLGQGFHFARPMSHDALTGALEGGGPIAGWPDEPMQSAAL